MPLFYQSGEQINRGDRVRLYGAPGEIDLVADPADGPNDWCVERFGGGVMAVEPKSFGRLFIDAPSIRHYEGLKFVSRGVAPC